MCSKISSAADRGGWRRGVAVGSGRGGRPESIGSVMRWLGAR